MQILCLFTFQYGRLKTTGDAAKVAESFSFTFQYGRLKTSPFSLSVVPVSDLHSNMVD